MLAQSLNGSNQLKQVTKKRSFGLFNRLIIKGENSLKFHFFLATAPLRQETTRSPLLTTTIDVAAMTILTESAFVESKSIRDNQLATVSHDRATEILNQVKAIYFALWQGTGTATTSQIAEFYEVSDDVVQKALQRH